MPQVRLTRLQIEWIAMRETVFEISSLVQVQLQIFSSTKALLFVCLYHQLIMKQTTGETHIKDVNWMYV